MTRFDNIVSDLKRLAKLKLLDRTLILKSLNLWISIYYHEDFILKWTISERFTYKKFWCNNCFRKRDGPNDTWWYCSHVLLISSSVLLTRKPKLCYVIKLHEIGAPPQWRIIVRKLQKMRTINFVWFSFFLPQSPVN